MGLKNEEVKKALIKNKGMVAGAAKMLNVTRQTVYNKIKANKGLQKVVDEQRETMKDFAENVLLRLINEGDFRAVKYYLETQAKDRGYVIQKEIKDVSEDSKKQIIKIGGSIIEF